MPSTKSFSASYVLTSVAGLLVTAGLSVACGADRQSDFFTESEALPMPSVDTTAPATGPEASTPGGMDTPDNPGAPTDAPTAEPNPSGTPPNGTAGAANGDVPNTGGMPSMGNDATGGAAPEAGGASTMGGAPGVGGMPGMGGAGAMPGTAGAPPDDGFDRGRAPEGEIIHLYDGNGFDRWEGVKQAAVNWEENRAEGYFAVVPLGGNNIITNRQNLHEDVFIHLEFWSPDEPANQTGQARGNSGVYLQSMFEVQILDSFGRQPEPDGCGAIYGVKAPIVNACNRAEEWNTYEIMFTAPRYNGNNKTANARVTVWLNDQLVQDNTSIDKDVTAAGNKQPPGPAPLMLQDHSDPVRYRNIWWVHVNK